MTVTQYVGSEERLRFPLSPLAPEPVVAGGGAGAPGEIEALRDRLSDMEALLSDIVAFLGEDKLKDFRSERETAYLAKSPAMLSRLKEALARDGGKELGAVRAACGV